MQPPIAEGDAPRIVILDVGKREPRHHGSTDIWTLYTIYSGSRTRQTIMKSRRAALMVYPNLTTRSLRSFSGGFVDSAAAGDANLFDAGLHHPLVVRRTGSVGTVRASARSWAKASARASDPTGCDIRHRD